MPCYFGCSTLGNRVSYTVYALLAILSIVFFSFWGSRTSGCFTELSELPQCKVLKGKSGATDDIQLRNPNDLQESLEQACESLGFSEGGSDFSDCVDCLTVTSNCFISNWNFLVAGVVLAVLTLIPCTFCCCFSNAPNAYSKTFV